MNKERTGSYRIGGKRCLFKRYVVLFTVEKRLQGNCVRKRKVRRNHRDETRGTVKYTRSYNILDINLDNIKFFM